MSAASLWLTACEAPSIYACEADAQCTFEGVQGACETSGYCSFSDPGCSSGQRYGNAAPADLAGSCVEPLPLPDTPHSTGGDETTGHDTSTSAAASSSGEFSDLDPSSSTTGDGVDTDVLDAGSESTTTGGHTCPEQFEAFDGPSLPPLWFTYDAGAVVVDGELSLQHDPFAGGFVGVGTLADLDMYEGSVTIERGQPPIENGYQQLVQLVNDEEAWVAFAVLFDSIQVRASTDDGGFEIVDSVELEHSEDHRWLRVVQDPDAGVLRFMSSGDGVAFETIGEVEVDSMAWSSLRLDLATTAWLPAWPHWSVSFRSFEHCSQT